MSQFFNVGKVLIFWYAAVLHQTWSSPLWNRPLTQPELLLRLDLNEKVALTLLGHTCFNCTVLLLWFCLRGDEREAAVNGQMSGWRNKEEVNQQLTRHCWGIIENGKWSINALTWTICLVILTEMGRNCYDDNVIWSFLSLLLWKKCCLRDSSSSLMFPLTQKVFLRLMRSHQRRSQQRSSSAGWLTWKMACKVNWEVKLIK